MARRKKTEDAAATTKTKGRSRKGKPKSAAGANEAAAPGPDLALAERKFAQKYPRLNVVPGSLRAGAAEGWGTKRILDLICTDCGSKRTIATSDAFHCDGRCVTCAKAARRANKQRAG